MNRQRFHSDMEASWELRPVTDETPGSKAHHDRFRKNAPKEEKKSAAEKNGDKQS